MNTGAAHPLSLGAPGLTPSWQEEMGHTHRYMIGHGKNGELSQMKKIAAELKARNGQLRKDDVDCVLTAWIQGSDEPNGPRGLEDAWHIYREACDDLERGSSLPAKNGATAKEFGGFIPSKTANVKPQPQERAYAPLSSLVMRPIEFLEKPFFQANAFHLLTGPKNAGKGTFLAHTAARFTRGELGSKRNVVWIAAGEDSLEVDVLPRIVAAKGEPGRIYFPKGFRPILPYDLVELCNWMVKIGDVGLVVLDPISGMLPGKTNTNLDNDVRNAIASLNDLADTAKCIIAGVRHMKKNVLAGALYSVMGSGDWINIPRVVLAIVMDDAEDDVRHVQVVAGNRLPRGTASRSFRIVGVDIVPGGEPVTKVEFLEGTGKDVDALLQAGTAMSNSKSKLAKKAMLDKLESVGASVESESLDAEIASECGLTVGAVKNIKTRLKRDGLIRVFPDKDDTGRLLHWNIERTNTPRPPELR